MPQEPKDYAIIKDRRARGFFWCEDAILGLPADEGPMLSAIDKLTYISLCRWADRNGDSRASVANLVNATSSSRASVWRSLGQLKELGLIEIESGKERGAANLIRICGVPAEMEKWRRDVARPGVSASATAAENPASVSGGEGVSHGELPGVSQGDTPCLTVKHPPCSPPPTPPSSSSTGIEQECNMDSAQISRGNDFPVKPAHNVSTGSPAAPEPNEDKPTTAFDLPYALMRMKTDQRKFIQIIGWFLDLSGAEVADFKGIQALVFRHAKSANRLVGFDLERLKTTMEHLRELSKSWDDPHWTLATVLKYVADPQVGRKDDAAGKAAPSPPPPAAPAAAKRRPAFDEASWQRRMEEWEKAKKARGQGSILDRVQRPKDRPPQRLETSIAHLRGQLGFAEENEGGEHGDPAGQVPG